MVAKKDLTGQTFGRLTVVKEGPGIVRESGRKIVTWLCQCSCGNPELKEVQSDKLGKDVTSCGCLKKEKGSIPPGTRFGRLVVVKRVENDGEMARVECLCDCGNTTVVRTTSLRAGKTLSCGCYGRKQRLEANTIHDKSNTRTYRIYHAILQRCYNENNTNYHNYGGRGIVVCERWLESFENFLADMGECPKGFSIERKDVNGNYEPGNCIWATLKEQASNKRNTRYLEVGGRRWAIAELARQMDINPKTLAQRIDRDLAIEDILSKTKLPDPRVLGEDKIKTIKRDLKTMRQVDVAKKHNVSYGFVNKIARGVLYKDLDAE